MHPAYRSAKPGIAPDCGMQLVPVYADELGGSAHMSMTDAGVARVDAAKRQLYGVQVTRVEQSLGQATLRVYGRVSADETRIYRVNLGTDGYVKETAGDAVGDHVTKNQHLAVVYSPEFLSVAGGYLSANERTPTGNAREIAAAQTQNASGAQARADRLRNLGMSDAQIDEISSSRKIPEDVYVVSPTDGFILSRDISPGMRFERHAELYRIADLSRVWILAEVFGRDASAFRPGATAYVTLSETGERLKARVSSVLPELDPATRALKPRLELANPGFHLRPGMFVDIEIAAPAREGLTVPADAVVNTGESKRVYVEEADGDFRAREVETGWSYGDRVQIVKGLSKGETVVSSGTFLVDSESRMHLATRDAASTGLPARAEMPPSRGPG